MGFTVVRVLRCVVSVSMDQPAKKILDIVKIAQTTSYIHFAKVYCLRCDCFQFAKMDFTTAIVALNVEKVLMRQFVLTLSQN